MAYDRAPTRLHGAHWPPHKELGETGEGAGNPSITLTLKKLGGPYLKSRMRSGHSPAVKPFTRSQRRRCSLLKGRMHAGEPGPSSKDVPLPPFGFFASSPVKDSARRACANSARPALALYGGLRALAVGNRIGLTR